MIATEELLDGHARIAYRGTSRTIALPSLSPKVKAGRMAGFIPSRAPWHRCSPKGGEQLYRIKTIDEAFARIAKECELVGNASV
jgi:hypothetical protein